jgi:hypothetical protein
MEAQLPYPIPSRLTSYGNAQVITEKTRGNIGTLAFYLHKAMCEANRKGLDNLTRDDLVDMNWNSLEK